LQNPIADGRQRKLSQKRKGKFKLISRNFKKEVGKLENDKTEVQV
jgi:hypothetical protein